jgi:hypothetical protein
MMISLTITVYTTENGGDAFQVHAADSSKHGLLVDVTDQYEVVAMGTDDGKQGFAVLKAAEQLETIAERRHPTGAEL